MFFCLWKQGQIILGFSHSLNLHQVTQRSNSMQKDTTMSEFTLLSKIKSKQKGHLINWPNNGLKSPAKTYKRKMEQTGTTTQWLSDLN